MLRSSIIVLITYILFIPVTLAFGEVRTEDQWISIRVYNRMRKNDVSFKNAKLAWGKFYSGSKSNEISAAEVDKIVVSPDATKSADSCGRSGALSGTQGSLDLYDGTTRICSLSWDCPWGASTNNFQVSNYVPQSSDYSVAVASWNRGPGAIGNVDITVAKLG
ncbi:Aegerolysin-domain-containing protein [Trichoderma asperelloides]|nr:Aegerolysin-domain-containing protein [Trichoderma asperelloides]